MRVIVLHSDIPAHAAPDEQDTLIQAEAIAQALVSLGHEIVKMPFAPHLSQLKSLVRETRADLLFNVVEAVQGSGYRAAEAIALFDELGIPYTGNRSEPVVTTCDKPLAKRKLVDAGLPTPAWSVAPAWEDLSDTETYIVKSAREDASVGLDDDAVVKGRAAIIARAKLCAERHGGAWFAEAFVNGREFNVAILEENGWPRVLPIAEMRFEGWPQEKPRIVGYAAKWDEASVDAARTVRDFAWAGREPGCDATLRALAVRAWNVFGLRGYARVDFRVDANGNPTILELNPNPCIEPQAGFAAAARQAGYDYRGLIGRIVDAALRC
jgi:D-alanine-D-alanine ligase